jgi:hypothetical protein
LFKPTTNNVIPKDVIINGPVVPMIKGLKVVTGVKCLECQKCFGVTKSFTNHAKTLR